MKDLYKKQEGLSFSLSQSEKNYKNDVEFSIDNEEIKNYSLLLQNFYQLCKSQGIQDYIDGLTDEVKKDVRKGYKSSIESIEDFIDLLDSGFFEDYDTYLRQIKKSILPSINYLIEIFQ